MVRGHPVEGGDGGIEDMEDPRGEDTENAEDIESLTNYDTEGFSDGDSGDENSSDFWENVEFPVSWQVGRSEMTKLDKKIRCVPHLMLYFVGQTCSDGGSTSAAGPAASHWENLLADLLKEVLLWLPAASQARFRVVCQKWLHMLSSPDFARLNFLHSMSQSTSPPLCAVRQYFGKVYKPSPYTWPPPGHDCIKPSGQFASPKFKAMKVDLSFLPASHTNTHSDNVCARCGYCWGRGVFLVYVLRRPYLGRAAQLLDAAVAYDMIGRFWYKVEEVIPQGVREHATQVGDIFKPMLNLRL